MYWYHPSAITSLFWRKRERLKSYQKLKPGTIEAWLVSDDPAEQHLASEALQQLGPDSARSYMASLLHKEQQIISRRRTTFGGVLLGTALLWLIAEFLWHNRDLRNSWVILFSMTHFLDRAFGINSPVVSRLQKSIALNAAASASSIQDSSLLLSAFALVDAETRPATMIALTRILPQFTLADRALLESDQWEQLVKLAQPAKKPGVGPKDAVFIGSIIRALGNVRYEAALPLMKDISAQKSLEPENKRLQGIASHYVTTWDISPATDSFAIQTETLPKEEKQMLLQHH